MMEKYEIIERLGQGSFGSVCKAMRKADQKIVAIKEISYMQMDQKKKQMLINEVNALRMIHNDHVVGYYDRIVVREKKLMYIVMEYCEKGDLQQLIRKTRADNDRIPESAIWQVLTDMCVALDACHYGPTKMIHRDIKPGNIFIAGNGHVKLGDFGLAREIDDGAASTYAGTPPYMSPELISHQPYDEKSDIWALGCVLFELADLHLPFNGSNEVITQLIQTGPLRRIPDMYSDDLFEVISSMMRKKPAERPTVKQLLENKYVKLYLQMEAILNERARVQADTARLIKKQEQLREEYNRLNQKAGRVFFNE